MHRLVRLSLQGKDGFLNSFGKGGAVRGECSLGVKNQPIFKCVDI